MLKSFYLFLLSFSSLIVFGQTGKTTKVLLSINDCRTNEPYYEYRYDTISFFKMPENIFAFEVVPGHYKNFPILLENVQVRNYKIKYKNSFKQNVYDTIRLSFRDINKVSICTNKLKNYKISTLANLRNNDSVVLDFHSESCFGSKAMRLVISKKSDKLIADLYNVAQNYRIKNHKVFFLNRTVSLLRTAELTDTNVDDFVKFENELKYVKGTGCTTTDWYDLQSKKLHIEREDGTCMWNGFYYLQKSIFGETD